MNRIIVCSLLLITVCISCRHPKKTVDKLDIAKQYYRALDNSDGVGMKALLADSLLTKQTDYDYEQTFSLEDYVEKWMKWDAVFDPSYDILQIEQENGIVKAKISKTDKRILFLNGAPFVTHEVLIFQDDKISTIATEYVNFNEETWERNKTGLLDWIEQNHPELNGFIYDQTESGGTKYLTAIELYKNRK